MANFDIEGALQAGYNREEILRHLAIAQAPATGPAAREATVGSWRNPSAQEPSIMPDMSAGVFPRVSDWANRIDKTIDDRLNVSMPVTGGPVFNAADLVQLPKTPGEAAALAAAALIPPARVATAGKGLLRAGSRALEGAAPEVGALSRYLDPAKITGAAVLRAAKAGPGKFGGFAKFAEANPTAGEDLFDLASAQPAIAGRPAVPRLDPTIPPKKGVSARMADAFNNPKVVEGIKESISRGHEEMPQDWYATSPLWQKYQEIWGDQALAKFERDIGYSAATSSGMRVPDNIRTGTYYSYLDEAGRPFPKTPAPGYGAKMQQTHREGALEIRDTGTVDPIANPKRAGYKENLLGQEDALTADRHWMRMVGMLSEDPRFLKGSTKLESGGTVNPRKLFQEGKLTMREALDHPDYWDDAPAENEYMHGENEFRKIANSMGYTTANAQGKAWVGAGRMTGLGSPGEPWMRLYAQRVAYTAARLGADPKVILDLAIRGKIPLLGLGALGALGAGLFGSGPTPEDDRQQ